MKHAEHIVAVVPAREFDENLPGKNVLPINDTNLLVHKIRQLKNIFDTNDIRVSSESDAYLKFAADEGVVPMRRPMQYADAGAFFGDFVHHIASTLECRHILWASPTSPLVSEDDFRKAMDLYFAALKQGYDSLITVNKIKRFLLDENGPLNFRFNIHERNAAALPVLYEFVNGVVIAPRESMLKWRHNWGVLPYKMELPPQKSVDICNDAEYAFARFLAGSDVDREIR